METAGSFSKTPTSFHDLPHEIAVDIFSRLPVKTLIRSTSVNKSWYSLIKNPKFISAQIRRSLSYFDETAVFIVPYEISPRNPCTLLSSETFTAIKTFEIPFRTKSGNVELCGSVNGLYCLTDGSGSGHCRDLYLWNPSIRRYKTVASSSFTTGDLTKSYCIVGFGFHKSSDDYRVVRVRYYKDKKSNYFGKVAPKVEVFSLKSNRWRRIRDAVVPGLIPEKHRTGTYVNGSIYWLPTDDCSEYSGKMWMLSFDFNNEVFRKVNVPNKVGNCVGKSANISLMELNGSVSLFLYYRDFANLMKRGVLGQHFCLWLMRHEDGAWIKHLRGELNRVLIATPLKITRSGSLIMEVDPEDQPKSLASINLRNLVFLHLGFGPLRGYSSVDTAFIEKFVGRNLGFDGHPTVDTSFIESLVLLDEGNALLKHAK